MYEIIPDELATHGLGRDNLTTSYLYDNDGKTWFIVDSRIISDLGPYTQDISNSDYPLNFRYLIETACKHLRSQRRTVVCCHAGQSRRNAVAIGVLMKHYGMDFHIALELVIESVPISWISMFHIRFIRRLFNIQ